MSELLSKTTNLSLTSILLLLSGFQTVSSEEKQIINNPPSYVLKSLDALRSAKNNLKSVQQPPIPSLSREVRLDMNVTYVDRKIYNPTTGLYDAVKLRGYEDAVAPKGQATNSAVVGPTIDIRPGQTIRLTLNNQLPPDPSCSTHGKDVNVPHCFNGTNLHSHGLWVNPSGNSDNVLISIRPSVSFQYEYNVPADHPAGTFWYHPHLHGSTALQVSSGMSGAIIIRGERPPTPTKTGDIDTLLKQSDGTNMVERLLVLQQIQYACLDGKKEITYDCKLGQVGGIETYDQFGPGSWEKSGRFTSINGQVLGKLTPAVAGNIERWRMIHAGVRDTINFEIRRKTGTKPYRSLSAGQTESWIDENCSKDTIPYGVVAQDGLTMSGVQMREQAILQPGYRVDALVVLPQAGEYCVVDADAPAAASVDQPTPSRRLLGIVTATGNKPVSTPIKDYLQNELIAAAERNMPTNVVDKVVSDLKADMNLSSFIPHPDIAESEVTGTQDVVFNIDSDGFQINGKSFDPTRVDRTLTLGGVDEWTMQSDFVSHPFHIHVNPFQVIKILDASGKDVSGLDAKDDGDPQYPGLKGVWKDTLWVKNPNTDPSGKYTIVVRTRYQRYIGEFVLHCHILDHEDQGMMQKIRITLPDGMGGTTQGHN